MGEAGRRVGSGGTNCAVVVGEARRRPVSEGSRMRGGRVVVGDVCERARGRRRARVKVRRCIVCGVVERRVGKGLVVVFLYRPVGL